MNQESFEMMKKGVSESGVVPPELAEYRVDNAVILAAGVTKETIYAPPKGLFLIDGVPIIERQICQLKEAGIHEIYIVVGYKKEMYFYLEEKYGVKLIGNPRLDKNNIYSLYLARDHLKNSYVCACDYYYKENPFSPFEFRAYYATAYFSDASKKFVVKTNHKGRIIDLLPGAPEGECIHGIAYFDKEFSTSFVEFMEEEIDEYRVEALFWQEFFARHIDDLDLYAKHCEQSAVLEFNDLRALRSINLLFVDSISTQIVRNICRELLCNEEDITYVDVLDAGHSNTTFKVVAKGKDYVYRYPGVSGKYIFNKEREVFLNKLAKKLGIDNTLLFIDGSGHKLSVFVHNAHPLDPNNRDEIRALGRLVRTLHDYDVSDEEKEKYAFDPLVEADRLLRSSCVSKDNLFEVFRDIRAAVHKISAALEGDHFRKAICHGNLNSNNCLITDHSFDLIDWEASGYYDVAYDFPFLGNYDFREEDLRTYLGGYFDREPTEDEYRHWLCCRAIQYWYYTCWAIYKESVNEDCGNLLLVFYEDCKKAVALAQRYIEFR